MSIIVQAWVYANSEAKGNDRLCLLAIADEADDDGTNAFPEQRRIAHKARTSLSTTRRSIDALEAAGEILVKRPEKTGRGHHNEYVVLMGRDPTAVAETMGWKRIARAAETAAAAMPEGGQSDPLSEPAKRAETRQNASPLDGAYPQTHSPTDQDLSEPKGSKPRPRFLEFDALVEAFGRPDLREEEAFYAKVARSLKAQGKTPAEIIDRGKRARARHPECTVNILLTRWTNYAPPRGRSPGGTFDDVARRDAEERRNGD